ncbi:MAG TPA: MFS transporter [Opitutae bacterium]|nr:MFS transporter [Opitutae bacterium]
MQPAVANERSLLRELLHPIVIVGALGYFVDIYDLTLFMTVRDQSLSELGLGHLIKGGAWYHDLMSWQMAGMLLGGILFGVLGDRLGRLATLFGSILLYSLANLGNAFVHTFEAYAAWRFVAGIGLAGELGGCIALVAETLSKERRGYGTTLVAAVGVMGAVTAGAMAEVVHWRTNYIIGGVLGLSLLVLRIGVRESALFHKARDNHELGTVSRGNFFALFNQRNRLLRYLCCVGIGLPTWYTLGILVQRASSHFAPVFHIQGEIITSRAITIFYLGLTFGDLGSGAISQALRSRRKVVAGFLIVSLGCAALYLFGSDGWTNTQLYALIFVMGLGMGYWALFITISSEQFGTNLRATAATSIPNFVRGSLILLTAAFTWLNTQYSAPTAAIVLGFTCFAIAGVSLLCLRETFGIDLDYLERD